MDRPAIRASASFFGAIIALQMWLIFHHSPWFDEAQALLIVRAPVSEILKSLHYEGHPAAWYVLLWLLDRIDDHSNLTLAIAQSLCVLGIGGLIWFRSPFSLPEKLLITLGYYFLFEYGVLARSYGLGALCILASVSASNPKWRWGFLAIAANVDAQFTIAAAALGLGFWSSDRKQSAVGPLILIVGISVATATVLPLASDLHKPVALLHGFAARVILASAVMSSWIVPTELFHPLRWGGLVFPAWINFLLGLASLALLTASVHKASSRAILGLIAAGLLVIGIAVYPLYPRHVGTLIVALIACLWIEREKFGLRANLKAFVVLSVSAMYGLIFAIASLWLPFSNNVQAAGWISEHGLQQAKWASWPGAYALPISMLLRISIVNPQKECRDTFIRWNYDPDDLTRMRARLAASGAKYLVTNKPLPENAKLLARFSPAMDGRPILLYEIDASPRALPACR